MHYYLTSEVISLIFLLILLISSVSGIRNSAKEYKYFVLSVCMAFLSNIFNIFATPGSVTQLLMLYDNEIEFFNFLGYLFSSLTVVFLTLYFIYSFTDDFVPYLKLRLMVLFIPFSFYILLLLTNHWTKLLFYVDNGQYIRGKLFVESFIVAIFFTILMPFLGLIGKNVYKPPIITIYSFAATTIIMVLVQAIFPNVLLVDVGIASALYIYYINLLTQNKDRDSLTGIYSRRTLLRSLQTEIKRNSGNEILSFSIKNMKKIHSDYGVLFGDNLIKNLLKKLEVCSGQASLYIITTDIFCIILSGKEENKQYYIKRIVDELKKPIAINEYLVEIDPIIAIIPIKETDSDASGVIRTLEYMLSNFTDYADENRVIKYQQEFLDSIRAGEKLEKFVLERIDNKKIEMYYQPIYCVASPNIMRAEALLRVKDDEGNFVPPDTFLSVARKLGRAPQITQIVGEQVIQFLYKCQVEEYDVASVAVNVSPSEIVKKGYADIIINMAERLGVDLSRGVLEITEDVLIKEKESVSAAIKDLQAVGIKFSLDDFGSMYSNITTMFSFPFTTIKIDKHVFWEVFQNDKFNEFFKHLLQGLRIAGYKVLIEGIETEEQFHYCVENGADYIQGYYYSMPLPEAEYIKFVLKNSSMQQYKQQ